MACNQEGNRLMVYTRRPNKDYTIDLANSVHFAYCEGSEEFHPLNRNYGILFASASVDEQDVIHQKGLINPHIFRTISGEFGIIANRVDAQGNEEESNKGKVLYWTSRDLIDFTDYGLVDAESICPQALDMNQFSGNDSLGDIVPGGCILIDDLTLLSVKNHWLPIHHTQMIVPMNRSISSLKELKELKATAVYSDGSKDDKQVEWDSNDIDFTKPGTYYISGQAIQESFPFPLTNGYADPVILPYHDKYFYLATNDNVNDIGIFVREAETKAGLFEEGFHESKILDVDIEKQFIQTFWAPEFHFIGDDLYILFAVGPKMWGPQCHMMRLKKGGNIMRPQDWETPIRVKRKDGSYLAEDGITLDMTYFKVGGKSYLVWSYRKHIGTPKDSGSMLYIAATDENDPTVLTSDPVLLSRPLYGWENIQRTINNEGPYPLITDDCVYITYSGGAANGYTYALGMLSIPIDGDFLNPKAWKKATTPVLSYYSIKDVYGPGHNSFFRDRDGKVMILYHGETNLTSSGIRCTGMHRVHFNVAGSPVFDVAGDRDIDPALAKVSLAVTID